MFEVVNYSDTLILLHFRINYSSISCSFIKFVTIILTYFVFQLKPKYIITQYQKQACLFSPFYVKQLDHDWKTDSLSNPRVKTDSLSTQGSVKDGWDQEQDKEPPKQSRWIDKAVFRYTHTKHFYTWCHSKQVIYQKQLKLAVNDAFGSNLWPCHDSLC